MRLTTSRSDAAVQSSQFSGAHYNELQPRSMFDPQGLSLRPFGLVCIRLMTATSVRSTGLELRFCRLSRKLNFSHPRCHHDPRVFYVAEDTSSSTTVASHSYRGPYHKIRIIDIPTPYGFLYSLLFVKVVQSPEYLFQSIPHYFACQLRRGEGIRRAFNCSLTTCTPYQHSIRSLQTELTCRLVKRFQTFADGVQKCWSTRMMRCGTLVKPSPVQAFCKSLGSE
ncbi:hypothetical protein P692DRAFT_20832885, partial [Suillus brevipes Sb2]